MSGLPISIKILSFRFAKFFLKFARNKVEAVEKHMKEEGENLKRLLEKGKGIVGENSGTIFIRLQLLIFLLFLENKI